MDADFLRVLGKLWMVGVIFEEPVGIFDPQGDLDQKHWSKHKLEQQRQNSRRERGESREGPQERGSREKGLPQEQQTRELHVVKKDVPRLGGTACCGARERLMIGPLQEPFTHRSVDNR